MAIQIQGNGGTVAEVDGTTFRAHRVSNRPLDYGTLGSYKLSAQTGTMAAGLAANSEIFQFRWTDATRLAAITKIIMDGAGGIVAFAAGFTKFEAMIARVWTTAGSGGAPFTLTGNNCKLRTSMGTTLLGDGRIASTAALGAGTKTLDSQGIGAIVSSVGATAGTQLVNSMAMLHDSTGGGDQPIILAQNEGVIVRATVPATGTWTGGVTIFWYEITAY